MRFFLIYIFCLYSTFSCYSQFSSQIFHNGFVVTSDKDTLKGKIKYDFETNSIQLVTNTKVRAFNSYKLFYFEIFDEVQKNYRQFYIISYLMKPHYKVPIMFELLYEGGISLLVREKIVQESVSANNSFYSSYNSRFIVDKLAYDFFFLYKNGKIIYFLPRKRHLLRIFSDKKTDMKTYIKKNKLKVTELEDLIRVVSFYNSI